MKIVNYDDAFNESLKYFNGDELATKSFLDKYALKNNEEQLLEKTPADMHRRIAKEFARVEKNKFKTPLSEDHIFNLLDQFRYIVPQGSPMYGIGNNFQTISLSNCYLADSPEDSYGGIHFVDEEITQISKRRGGVGVDISKLRPEGMATHNASRSSTGIISFMDRYSNSILEVGQSGRRGALIITLSIHHPQILDFVNAKKDKTKVTGANISVRLSDEFLTAVTEDKDYELRWPVDSKKPKISKNISARLIWNEIIKSAHADAEPGLLFWDNVLNETPSSVYEEYKPQGTNPCSELILSPLDSCRLLLLNLYSYVKKPFTKEAEFDYELFIEHSKIAQRLMDDLVDLEAEKIEKIIEKVESDPQVIEIKCRELNMWKRVLKYCKEGRRTGTGITGLGDAIAALGVKYASDESIQLVDNIFKNFKLACYRSSVDMAKEIGAFTCYDADKEKKSAFIQRIKKEDPELYLDMVKYGRRNIAISTISPAGTVSLLTRTTSGVEPLFMMAYLRRKKLQNNQTERVDFVDKMGVKWQNFEVYHPKVKEWMDITGETDVTKSPWHKCCAEDINWVNRVKLQATIQKHICHSISSTVNLPEDVSVKDVTKIYETAWKEGCKGITVYRKNSRDGVLIENPENKDKEGQKLDRIPKTHAPVRPKELPCDIYHVKITKKLDKLRVFDYLVAVGLYNGKDPYEVFAVENGKYDKKLTKGRIIKEGKGKYHLIFSDDTEIKNITADTTETEDALTRMTSTTLRHGADVQYIVEQLNKVTGVELFGFAKAIARSLKHYIKDQTVSNELCSECGVRLIFENGCFICKNCGHSRCS